MSTLLVYRNTTPDVMAWAAEITARTSDVGERRTAYVDALCEAHGGPGEDERGAYSNGNEFIGIAWPAETPVPKGWRRPSDDHRLIKPHLSTRIGKAAAAELSTMAWPDPRDELSRLHGMRSLAIVPDTNRYYTPGVRIETDGVWVTWGSRDVAGLLPEAFAHGWDRVSLAEYIARFGEDAL